jgi:hypothetical protein
MNYIVTCVRCKNSETWTEFDFTAMKHRDTWQCTGYIRHSKPRNNMPCDSKAYTYDAFPTNADDIKRLRANYNERHKNDPGFVPSVEYVMGPDGKTRPRES